MITHVFIPRFPHGVAVLRSAGGEYVSSCIDGHQRSDILPHNTGLIHKFK
jgi:hypothetical protein